MVTNTSRVVGGVVLLVCVVALLVAIPYAAITAHGWADGFLITMALGWLGDIARCVREKTK